MIEIGYRHLFFDDPDSGDGGDTGAGGDNNAPSGAGQSGAGTGGEKGKASGGAKADKDRDEKKYSDADLDRIIEKKLVKWKEKQKSAVDEAARLASMSAQERAEYERDQLKAELEELKRANTAAEMEKTARAMLQTDGVNVPDEIVSSLIGKDAEATSANVKSFAKAFKTAVQEEVKAQLSHKRPSAGASGKAISLEDIDKITDPIKRQEMLRKHPELYAGRRKNGRK